TDDTNNPLPGTTNSKIIPGRSANVTTPVIAINPSPRQFTESLAVCLEPFYDNLYEALMEQFAEDPDIFSIPGDETGAVGFGKRWMRAMEELTVAPVSEGTTSSRAGPARRARA
ncbi:hypothetical protein ACWG5P_34165, partial [Streptomyces prasinus]